MILNALFPVFTLLCIGVVFKRAGLTDKTFLQMSDRLVYFIFFPALLFWKIGGNPAGKTMDWGYCLAMLCALAAVFFISTAFIYLAGVPAKKAGSFSQGCYRFNTYIGMAVVINALGEEGGRLFGILLGLVIPMVNVMAVGILIWFGHTRMPMQKKIGTTLKALISNPLILACGTGILYSQYVGGFPVFVENALSLMSSVTLPLALISVGGALSFKGMKDHFGWALAATTFKLVALPALGLFFLNFFSVGGISFQVAVIFLTLPTSTAVYVLSSQLGSDTELASVTIVISTLGSFFTLMAALIYIQAPPIF